LKKYWWQNCQKFLCTIRLLYHAIWQMHAWYEINFCCTNHTNYLFFV
jgi:hypothetical protein